MYLYRVVPNSIMCTSTLDRFMLGLNSRRFIGAEDIYYDLGYTSFIDEVNTSNQQKESCKSKYFFLSLDDAIKYSGKIVNSFGKKGGFIYRILVYDFPLDVVMQNMKYECYKDEFSNEIVEVLETKIDDYKFGNESKNSSDILPEMKFNKVYDVFRETMFDASGVFCDDDFTLFDYVLYIEQECYGKGLGKNQVDCVINDLLTNHDSVIIRDIVETSNLNSNIIKYNGNIVKCPFILNTNFSVMKYGIGNARINGSVQELNKELISNYSIDNELKYELLNELKNDNDQNKLVKILKNK